MSNETRLLGSDIIGLPTVGVGLLNILLTIGLYALLSVIPGNSSVLTVIAVGFGPTIVLSALSGYHSNEVWRGTVLGITPAIATLIIVLFEEQFRGGEAETLGIVLIVVLLLGLILATVSHRVGRYAAQHLI